MYKPLLGRRISSICSPSVSSSVYHRTFNCAYYAQKSPMFSYKPCNIRHRSVRVLLRSRGSSAGSISITNRLLHGPCQLVLCMLDQPEQNGLVQDPAAVAGMPHGRTGRERASPTGQPLPPAKPSSQHRGCDAASAAVGGGLEMLCPLGLAVIPPVVATEGLGAS